MAKSEGGLKSGGASVQFRWPLAVGLFLCLILLLWLWTPDASTYVSLTATQFDLLPVGREDLDAVPASVRGILLNPDLAETFVSSRSEAARRAEFEPRLPQSNGSGRSLPSPKLFVVAPIHTKVTIHVAQLESALSRIRATDLSIPGSWDGVPLEVNISAGVVADYGRIRLGQRLPVELRAPDGFPMDRFLEVLFRIGGMNAPDATALEADPASVRENTCLCPATIESFRRKCSSPRGRGRSCATCLMTGRKGGLSPGTHGIESIFFPELSPRLRPWR